MYTKLANIESMLSHPGHGNNHNANQTPNTKKQSPSTTKANLRKHVMSPQYNRTKCPPGSSGKKVELVDLSQEEDELNTLGMNQSVTISMVGRRLPFTASPNTETFKIPKTEPLDEDTSSKRGCREDKQPHVVVPTPFR